MSKRIIRNRRARYGGMTVLLTVLLITVVVLFNSLFTTLAKRYSWYASLNRAPDYSVTESCYTLLDSILAGQEADIRIIFCDTEKNLLADSTSKYVYQNAVSLAERFSDKLSVECHNIWLDPMSVKHFNTTLNPATGESVETALKSTSVIIANGDYYRVYALTEFFVFEDGDTSKLWAYNGEKKLAAGILHAIDSDGAVVALTNNHGEVFYDYELLYLLDDAGYSIRYFDLYTEKIPDNCNLIITYNPNSDLTVSDGVSSTSEIDTLNTFLSTSGNSYLVFLENGTPALPNLESFLSEWGVDTMYYESNVNNFSYRYMVQDASKSLTSDGYTIYGTAAEAGRAGELVGGLSRGTVFKNATALQASNGFASNGDGSYTNASNGRIMYSLFEAGDSAVSWANGKPVDNKKATLFAFTEQTNGDGKTSGVGVCGSVDIVSEDFLQSAVHGNTDTMMQIFEGLGKSNTPKGLTIKPFESSEISTITTAEMWRWTLVLSLAPAVIVTALAVVVLVKRRNA